MSIKDLWQLLKKKGYDPRALFLPQPQPQEAGTIRVDLQACFYNILMKAASLPEEVMFTKLANALSDVLDKSNAVLYIDGSDVAEKEETHKARQQARSDAATEAEAALDKLQAQLDEKKTPRKQQHIAARKGIQKSFRFSSAGREALEQFLKEQGWDARVSSVEADVEIAKDCGPNDIVLTTDSDALVYGSINTVWRLMSRTKVLVYKTGEVCSQLELPSKAHLTALGIVCHNDYHSNVPGFGTATNRKMIKGIDDQDVASIVASYRSHPLVVAKLEETETETETEEDFNFSVPVRVFVNMKETPLEENGPAGPAPNTTHLLQTRYQALCDAFEEMSQQRQKDKKAKKDGKSEPANRHKPNQAFNKYRTIDMPPNPDPDKVYNPRYTPRRRFRKKSHGKPSPLKQYTLKPYTPREETDKKTPADSSAQESSNKKPRGTPPGAITSRKKLTLLNAMGLEHPTVTLDVGTLHVNSKRALTNHSRVQKEVCKVLRKVTRLAADIKRKYQRLIGLFIERISTGEISEDDRPFLDLICERLPPEQLLRVDEPEEDPDNEETGNQTNQKGFALSLMTYLYSNNLPSSKGVGPQVQAFIRRLEQLGLLTPKNPWDMNARREFPGSSVLSSAASQVTSEMKRFYRKGTLELQAKLTAKSAKSNISDTTTVAINHELSAIENFLVMNRLCGHRRRIVPMTGKAVPFFLFSESDLVGIFMNNDQIKAHLLDLIHVTFKSATSQKDVNIWLESKPLGYLITRLITDVGRGRREGCRSKDFKGYRRTTKMLELEQIQDHVNRIRSNEFDPTVPDAYSESGYMLRSSIRTDGFRLQLTAFKLKELNCVKYRRLHPSRLPERLTDTLGGTDYYLSEVHNVIKSKEDVERLWGCEAKDVKVLGLDLGQKCVVGAYAYIPEDPVFHNLVATQKSMYQPHFKYRRWEAQSKEVVPEGSTLTIKEMESSLPALRGPTASLSQYVLAELTHEEALTQYYDNDNNTFKRNTWDAQKAKEGEYNVLCDRLLGMVGGSIGQQRHPDNNVVIGIGTGKFSSCNRLPSLHTRFESHFVRKARALGYIVVGVEEYYTSKKCPECHNFVGHTDLRHLYCSHCKAIVHRDVLGAQNIVNAVRGQLLDQERPLYLHPVDQDGRYPWLEARGITSGTSTSSGTDNTGTSTSTGKGKGKAKCTSAGASKAKAKGTGAGTSKARAQDKGKGKSTSKGQDNGEGTSTSASIDQGTGSASSSSGVGTRSSPRRKRTASMAMQP
ncbi:MAG: hypothetical protein J3Q66DRAFT_333459 [Benniella sp.]|nr:MAG: hypothetical protein J3Q66DRAFT_333459 [Benniella sp.]